VIQASTTDTKTGRPMIILGLEEGNVTRLRSGDPIHIHADHLGFKGEIIIILGKDAAELQKALSPCIGPETNVIDSRNRKKQ